MVGRCRYDLKVFSARTVLKWRNLRKYSATPTVQATEVQCRTETNVSEYSEDGAKPQTAENRRRARRHPEV